MTSPPKLWAIVPAAGIGRRMGHDLPKQYLKIGQQTVLEITLNKLAQLPIAGLCVALATNDTAFDAIRAPALAHKVEGGAERADSVLSALNWLVDQGAEKDWALVHDAARPCVCLDNIRDLIAQTIPYNRGGLLAVRVADTLKKQHADGTVTTLDRQHIWQAQTPQLFPVQLLRRALLEAMAEGASITDEASAMERLGIQPVLVPDSRDNIKITQPEDLALAEFILTRQRARQESINQQH